MATISNRLRQLLLEELNCHFNSLETTLLDAQKDIQSSLMETGASDFEQGDKKGMVESLLLQLGKKINLDDNTQDNLNKIYFDAVFNQRDVWGLGKTAKACDLTLSRYEMCFYLKAFSIKDQFDGDINAFLALVKNEMPEYITYNYHDGVAWNKEKIPSHLLSADKTIRKQIIEYLKLDKGWIQTETDLFGTQVYSAFSFIEYMDDRYIKDPVFMKEALNINSLFFHAAPKEIKEIASICIDAIIRNREIRDHLEVSDDYKDKCLLRVYEEYLPDYYMSRETIIKIKDNEELLKRGIELVVPEIEIIQPRGDLPF